MPRQALASRPERVNVTEALKITDLDRETLLQHALRGEIPGAAKLVGSWTFDLLKLCAWAGKPAPAPIYHLDRLGPRGLDRERAAAHLKLSLEDFDQFLLLGRIPQPLSVNDQLIWPIQNLALRKRKPKSDDRYAGVYIIGFQSFIKIGMSGDVTKRIADIQDWLPTNISVHRIFIGEGRELEVLLHQRFSEYRLRGEWFELKDELAEWVQGGCR